MTLLLDTNEIAPEYRREAWSEVHRDALFPLVIDFRDDHRFHGRAQIQTLGPLALLRFTGDASVVRRTTRAIAASDPEHLQLALAHRGACEVSQGGRTATLGRGDLTTWDSSHPFTVPHRGSFDLVILTIPIALAGVRRASGTARLIEGSRGAGALAGMVLRETWRQLESGALSADDPDLQDALLALTRSLLRTAVPVAPRTSVLPGLAAAARAYALRHLGDFNLVPASIAREQHVSLRHLQAAFARDGETISGWLRRTRLERIRADLADPAFAAVPVGGIGARWGMANHAHMSRAFRAQFGCTPSDFRRASRATAAEVSSAGPSQAPSPGTDLARAVSSSSDQRASYWFGRADSDVATRTWRTP